MKGKLYEESKRDNKCAICGELIPKGTPTFLRQINGNWEGWCPKHGAEGPETAPESIPEMQGIQNSLDALLTGVSKDLELLRLDLRGIYDELKASKILLEQIKGQGMK